MALTKDQKIDALKSAIEVAKEYARGSMITNQSPSHALKEAYDTIIQILEEIETGN